MADGGFISKLDPDLIIQEAMYGFIMALTLVTTAQVGLVHYPTRQALVMAIIGMDFVWGAIDMYIFYRIDLLSRSRMIHRYTNEFEGADRETRVEIAKGELRGTMFEFAGAEDRRRMAEVFADSRCCSSDNLEKSTRHYVINALTAFFVTIMTVIPSVVCLEFIEDFTLAALTTSIVSVVALFFVGYRLSPSDTPRSKVITGLTVAVISLLFTLFAAAFGG